MTDNTPTRSAVLRAAPAAAEPDATTTVRSEVPGRGVDAQSVSLVAVFTALLIAAAVVPGIPVGSFGVPVTLQTLAVVLTGLVLGPVRGGLAVGVYLLVGLVGLPVFSKGQSGLQVLAGPTGGYLLSFALAAVVVGAAAHAVVRRTRQRSWVPLLLAASVITTFAVVHVLGVLGLMVNLRLPLSAAITADLPFLPGDLLKDVIAVVAAVAVHRAFPDVLVRSRRTRA